MNSEASAPPNPTPKRQEWIVVFFALAVFLAFNAATCRWYPAVAWTDEVFFGDSAMNYAQTGKFVTRVWSHQEINTFPALNCPLYSMTLAGWLSVTKPTLVAARTFNYVMAGIATFLMWLISWRFEILTRPVYRLLLIGLIELGYGISIAFRSIRPDMLGAVLVLLLVLSFSVASRRGQAWMLLLLSAAIVWTGLNVALAIALAGLTAWLTIKAVSIRKLLPVALGGIIGGLTLFIFMDYHQVLSSFIAYLSNQTGTDSQASAHQLPASFFQSFCQAIRKCLHNYVEDCSVPPLLAGTALCWLVVRRKLSARSNHLVLFLTLLFILIPLGLNTAGHYIIFYSYMMFYPVCLLFLTLLEKAMEVIPYPRQFFQVLFTGIVVLACGLGLPLHLLLNRLFCKIEDHQKAVQTLAGTIHQNDSVFTDFQAFYDIREITPNVYVPPELIPEGQNFRHLDLAQNVRNSISVMVISPKQNGQYAKWLGGNWESCGAMIENQIKLGAVTNFTPVEKKITSYYSRIYNWVYPLEIMRRQPIQATNSLQ